MSQEFGDRLKHRRQELNMTQSDVAGAADLTPAARNLKGKNASQVLIR